jgi:5'-nucleotidase
VLILLDQDGVLADFEHGFLSAWRQRFPHIPPIEYEDRRSFHIREDYGPALSREAESLYTAPGFIRGLAPIPGAVEAYHALLEMGMDVRIVSSPLLQYENCVAEKYQWVERHLGREATQRLMLTRDKTLVHGDFLIDDKPKIEGFMRPHWKHIVYDAPYNRHVDTASRITWQNWRSVLAAVMYRADR